MSDTPFGFGPPDRDRDDRRRESGAEGSGASGSSGGGDPSEQGPKDPFGFGKLPPGGNDPSGGGTPGFPGMPGMPGGAGGFDMSQLGQMLSQLGQMLSQAGTSGGDGPVNYDLAQQMAVQQLSQTTSSLTDAQRTA
ncbi:MAG: zinc-dependent metalloprotease, partial [Actinomycetota bacterium]|nr:zinc-dependent metalloprotease [Actinomycetota bacterium]